MYKKDVQTSLAIRDMQTKANCDATTLHYISEFKEDFTPIGKWEYFLLMREV